MPIQLHNSSLGVLLLLLSFLLLLSLHSHMLFTFYSRLLTSPPTTHSLPIISRRSEATTHHWNIQFPSFEEHRVVPRCTSFPCTSGWYVRTCQRCSLNIEVASNNSPPLILLLLLLLPLYLPSLHLPSSIPPPPFAPLPTPSPASMSSTNRRYGHC
jgi:hypothetical protein